LALSAAYSRREYVHIPSTVSRKKPSKAAPTGTPSRLSRVISTEEPNSWRTMSKNERP